jgi:hypothetical protein
MTEHSFHGINTSRPKKRKVLPMCPVRSVTYVSGRSRRTAEISGGGAKYPHILVRRPRCIGKSTICSHALLLGSHCILAGRANAEGW